MSKITLYCGKIVNGVHVVLTQDAYKAHEETQRFFEEHGYHNFSNLELWRRLANGTMTFVPGSVYIQGDNSQKHYGSLDMMDALLALCEVERVSGLLVPFSGNKHASDNNQLLMGYGYNVERWTFLVYQATLAHKEHSRNARFRPWQ